MACTLMVRRHVIAQRHTGVAEMPSGEPYERESSRYRNGAANQADGYGQDMDRYQGNHRTVAPTHYDRGQNGSPNGPYNGQYADRQNEPGYGDTRGDRYGGGGFNGGRGYGARPSNGSYDQHRTDAPYYGAEFIQDMEKGRSDSRYAQREQDFDASWIPVTPIPPGRTSAVVDRRGGSVPTSASRRN